MFETSYTIKIKFDKNGNASIELINHAKGKKFEGLAEDVLETVGELVSQYAEM